MDAHDAEALASDVSRTSGLDDRPRCDSRVLALCHLGLRLIPHRQEVTALVGDRIYYRSGQSEDAQAFLVAHECGHFLAREWGCPPELEEAAASRIGTALMLPRIPYLRDLLIVGWDLPALCKLWPLASPWIHARRIVEVTNDAVCSRWTSRAQRTAVFPEGFTPPVHPPPAARDAAHRAFDTGVDQFGPMQHWRFGGEVIGLSPLDYALGFLRPTGT